MNNCRHVQKIRLSDHHSILNPQKWICAICENRENVWACLSCSHVACGRYLDEHIQLHYQATKHPLSMDVHEKYVYCYECGDYVLNDNLAGDIKILRSCLQATTNQSLESSSSTSNAICRRRSSRVQRSNSLASLLQVSSRCDLLDVSDDVTYADLWLRRYYLLANAFNKWKSSSKAVCSTQVSTKGKQTIEEFSIFPQSNGVRHAKKRRHTIAGVTGLRNLGNTCYMNSILQVLRHLHQFSKVFIEDGTTVSKDATATESNSTNGNNVSLAEMQLSNCSLASASYKVANGDIQHNGRNGNRKRCDKKLVASKMSLSHELHSLLRIMWSGKLSMVSPHKMLYAVWNIIPFFRGYSQQDAQEFLSEFLDKVQSEMDNLCPVSKDGPSSPAFCIADSSASNGISGDDLVTQLFQGELISQVRCLACGHQSDIREAFVDLSLEFPLQYHTRGRSHNDVCQLEAMLGKFMEVEKLDGRIYACDGCNRNRRKSPGKTTAYSEAEKRFLINKLPHVLRLHLKRFMWSDRNSKGKISVNVAFPQRLDVQKFCHPDVVSDCSLYNLSAVVVHHGRGFGSGHYTAYCWNSEADSWVHCNDTKMQMVSIDDVYKAQAYILIYTRSFHNETSNGVTSNTFVDSSASRIPKYCDLKRQLNGDAQSSFMWKKRKTTIW